MAINPNWPVLMYDWGPFWNANGAAAPGGKFTDLTSRTRGRVGIQRGRQYELDQIRAGTMSMSVVNTDGSLDPASVSGPWYGHIMPYQPVRVRAQWPPTANLLTQCQATGGDLGGYAIGSIASQPGVGVLSDTDTGSAIAFSALAWQGQRVFQATVPNGSASGAAPLYTQTVSGERSATYTAQIRVRNVTPSTTLQVAAFISWSTAAGTATRILGTPTTLTGSYTAPWTQLTVTGTLGAATAYMSVGVVLTSAATADVIIQADGWQLERGSTATSWTAPGVWYPVYAGFVERYPSSWTMSGTYGTVNTTSVDAISLLSQRVLRDPLTEEIYSRNPRFLYTLGDPQNSQSCADAVGANPAAPLVVSKSGPGSLTFGNQITSTTSGGTYTGSTGTVVTINNPGAGAFSYNPATLISLDQAGIKGPANPGAWTRMIAFRYTGPIPADHAVIWCSSDSQRSGHYSSGSAVTVSITSNGWPAVYLSGPTGVVSNYYFGGATNCADGNWHLLIFGYSQSSSQMVLSQDGFYSIAPVGAGSTPTGLQFDSLGNWVDPVYGNETLWNYQGDISFAAEWPIVFGASDITAVYTAWKNSFAGDSSDARYKRILGWAGYTGPKSIQTGVTTTMGPAAVAGQDAMSALQAVVDTENGEHFVAADGTVTFRARSARYNALVPVYTFGEMASLGEIPYEECHLDLDPTRLANIVKITQASTNQAFTASDATSQANFFPRSFARTINSASTQECQDAANYLLSRYRSPAVRVASVRLHPSANPTALWPVCLGLELGTRIRVMRRPPAPAAPIQVECFVESISWEFSDAGDAYVTLQCSPADLTPYGLFAAFHTTLATSPAAGVSTITINAGSDNTNPAAAQLGPGQQLVLGLGTATQETVTIQSVGTTTAGWTTATITLTAATTQAHTAGDTVCEPLPSGVTSATTWDAIAKFDSAAFAY
ncbi:hypothetical protein F7Q99_20220 [Streptomyces kaniharaensis]|uniref:Uncharacterized protein n=1 Tax=Streptomyces kaniharaensis TaxID=212423 RepID=A0A6N7KW33_9ACTN|nr:hypothetical protein [Streptomyces kaniharaensis]MQS14527.1 hypothetical protein [Streptomyces kaniharaensis]